jgi:hypothetical protein
MIGSRMNTAAVTWFILQKMHSGMSLSTLVVLQTIPAFMMLSFTGVIIDREDRRRLIIVLPLAGRSNTKYTESIRLNFCPLMVSCTTTKDSRKNEAGHPVRERWIGPPGIRQTVAGW